ncbi:MAG: hypothetical protein E6Q40_13115 [Cupriavidus sp.]|nr:MAG: hypothetical protein E6Q40_13115 [Cupriavidus sp.]
MATRESVRRLLLAVLILLAAASVYANTRWFGAHMYLKFADERGQSYLTRGAARHAASIALRLQPSSARALQSLAGSDLFEDQIPLALDEFRAALQLAPADAYLWRDYALALIYAGQFGPRLNLAVAQAQGWALQSRLVHFSLAVAGLRVYDRSDEELRKLWMHSIRIAYPDYVNVILGVAYVADQDLLLCNGDVIPKPETNVWCAAARWRHGLCSDAGSGESGCFAKGSVSP